MRSAMIRAFWSALAVAACHTLLAQSGLVFELHHYRAEHGLSNRHITALVQDDIGYVWAGSVSGLDRLDGHAVRNWSVSDGLSGGRVDALRRDAEGLIWVFSTSAANDLVTIDVIDPRVGLLQPFSERFPDASFDPGHLVRVGPQRADGTILFGARSPARCIRYQRDGRFIIIPVHGDRFEPLGDDAMGNIIGVLVAVDSTRRIVRIDGQGREDVLRPLDRGATVEPLISGRRTPGALYMIKHPGGITELFDTYSELSLAAHDRAGRDNPADPVYKPINITPLGRRGMHMIDTWIMDADDRILFDLKTAHPEIGNSVKDCMVDNSGDPWVATEFGLFHVELRGDDFERLLWTENIPEGYGVLCRGMAWHEGRLYVSTEWEGAMTIDHRGDSLHVDRRPDPQYLFATHVADDGTWWRGGPQVVEREDTDGRTRRYAVADKVWSLLSHVEGGLLMGGLEGLRLLDPGTGQVRDWNDAAHPELAHAHVLQLERGTGGDIMATTSKGFYRIGPKGKVIDRWWSQAEGTMRLPYDDLHHCLIDAQGIFWLSTRGAGLVRFDPSTGAHQQYTMRNGFPNNMVYAAYEDKAGQLWLPTDGGIVRFDKSTRQSAVFTSADGITHDEFNRLAHAQADDGRLYFGGMNGITAFTPSDFQADLDQVQPPLVFTGFMRYSAEHGGMQDRTVEMVRSGKVELGEDGGSIQISFSLLSFEGTGRIVYAWRLLGVEEQWNYQKDPSVRLDRLPYGEHVLEVKARDAEGRWSDHVLQLPIHVQMPWQASRLTWVGAGALAMVIVLIPFLIRRRGRKRLRVSPVTV